MSKTYTLAEEMALGWPIPCPTSLACDGRGCQADATVLVEGASLCDQCAASFGINAHAIFSVPNRLLTGNDDWRQARAELYRLELARLNLEQPIEKTAERDQALDAVIGRRVEQVIADALTPRPS